MDGDLGRQLVGQVVQLPATADWHQDAGGAFLDGNFNDSDGIKDRFDGTAQVHPPL